MRLTACLLGLAVVVASVPAWADECENSPYNCRVPNYETPANGESPDANRKYNDFDKSYT